MRQSVSRSLSLSVERPLFRIVCSCSVVIGIAIALVVVIALPIDANGSRKKANWPMIGHDVSNTRSQPTETKISPRNVARLAPKWILYTNGDVSATPAVGWDDDDGDDEGDSEDDDRARGRGGDDRGGHKDRRRVLYFPDWGNINRDTGMPQTPAVSTLWKVDAESGRVIWSNPISKYNLIANSISRTSPVLAHGMVFIGDLNGNMMAVDVESGDLRWRTELDPNPNTIVTTSPIVYRDRLYISTSSAGGGEPRMVFRGSMIALDIWSGKIIWQTFVLPDNGGVPGGFAGGAFVNPPAIDVANGLIYGAAGQLYFQPASVAACLAAAPGGWKESCYPPGVYSNSVVAFDLRTGQPRWSFRGAGNDAWELACGSQPPDVTWCPAAANYLPATPAIQFSIWDFAGAGANVFRVVGGGRPRNVVGIGQKSGV
jgi:polyvinyl alcohol dehydrogenase (cytochrome)